MHQPTDLGRTPIRRNDAAERRPRGLGEFDQRHHLRALSHDLGSTMMLLEGSFARLKTLVAATSTSTMDEAVAHVSACLNESKRLLGDLAQLARSGGIEMDATPVSLDEVIDEVLFEQRQRLGDRHLRVEVHRPLPVVWCNRRRLKQLVANLVGNAVTHGCDPKSPMIEISAKVDKISGEKCQGRPAVVLRVCDNGQGMAVENLQRVFLPGVRLDETATNGCGMGLAIVRNIAEHYGGRAWIDADCSSGTAVMASLPSAEPRRATIEHDGPHRGVPPFRGHARPRISNRHGRA